MGLKGSHSAVFFFFNSFLGLLSLVLPSWIMYSCPSRLYPFYCPFCGPMISPSNLTGVSKLTAFMSVMCYFVLNLKPFLDLVLQLRLSSVLKSLRLLTWLLPSITPVLMWHLQDLNESGKWNGYKRVNSCHFWSEVQGCRAALTSMSGEPLALECDVALACLYSLLPIWDSTCI